MLFFFMTPSHWNFPNWIPLCARSFRHSTAHNARLNQHFRSLFFLLLLHFNSLSRDQRNFPSNFHTFLLNRFQHRQDFNIIYWVSLKIKKSTIWINEHANKEKSNAEFKNIKILLQNLWSSLIKFKFSLNYRKKSSSISSFCFLICEYEKVSEHSSTEPLWCIFFCSEFNYSFLSLFHFYPHMSCASNALKRF